MDFEAIRRILSDVDKAISVQMAETLVPTSQGLYSILVKNITALPLEIRRYQSDVSSSRHVIYIGEASGEDGLRQRLVKQDLMGMGPSTFFRSLGAVLGYSPPKGSLVGKRNQNNYRFSAQDREQIQIWIAENLAVNFVVMEQISKGELVGYEKSLIREIKPSINIANNPSPCQFVVERRTKNLWMARGR